MALCWLSCPLERVGPGKEILNSADGGRDQCRFQQVALSLRSRIGTKRRRKKRSGNELDDTRTNSLAALALTLLIVVVSLVVVRKLQVRCMMETGVSKTWGSLLARFGLISLVDA